MSRDAIEDLVHRYSDAVVHRDADRWIATWSEDALWDLGKGRRVEGRDAVLTLWQRAMEQLTAVVQTVLNGTVDLDTDAGTGTGRWYIQEITRRADGSSTTMLGHYDDRYRRDAGRWLFTARELTWHYHGPADLPGTFGSEQREA